MDEKQQHVPMKSRGVMHRERANCAVAHRFARHPLMFAAAVLLSAPLLSVSLAAQANGGTSSGTSAAQTTGTTSAPATGQTAGPVPSTTGPVAGQTIAPAAPTDPTTTPAVKTIPSVSGGGTTAGGVPDVNTQVETVGANPGSPGQTLTITLQDAIKMARANTPEYTAALTDAGIAHEDKVQARAALLPNVVYHNQGIYTQPLPADRNTPAFIANNGVREYISQGTVHQSLNIVDYTAYRRASALEKLARAKAEIATRGLIVTVVQRFYGVATAQRKLANSQRALDEAHNFLDISRKLENGGEVAHSDVIKAQLQANDRYRDLKEAQLALEEARVSLAVILFRDFNQSFAVADDLSTPEPLPVREEVEAAAKQTNPELAVALSAMQAARLDTWASRAGYLPAIGFDYQYGIDSPRFAWKLNGQRNTAYAGALTVDLPIWNWGATQSKLRQSLLRQKQAQVELSAAQRKLLGDLQTFYMEAQTSQEELNTLRESAELAATSLRLTTLRYQSGESSVLEVVDAQTTLTQARNNLNDGEVRYRVALAQLQTLTGALNP